MFRFTEADGLRSSDGSTDAHVERLERLAADILALRDGRLPMSEALAGAPFLEGWIEAATPMPCLVGRVTGHPRLVGAGRPIATSDLWVDARELGWIRTLSRFYRLGRPREPIRGVFG